MLTALSGLCALLTAPLDETVIIAMTHTQQTYRKLATNIAVSMVWHHHTSPTNCSLFQLFTLGDDCDQQLPTPLSFRWLVFPPSVTGLSLLPQLGCGTACQSQLHQQQRSTRSSSGWKPNFSFAAMICRLLMHANIVFNSLYCCTTHVFSRFFLVKCPSSLRT